MPSSVHVDLRLGKARKSRPESFSRVAHPVCACSGAASFFGSLFAGSCPDWPEAVTSCAASGVASVTEITMARAAFMVPASREKPI